MSETGPPPSDPDNYIRGARGSLDRRAVIRLLVGFCFVVLLTLTVVLAISAIDENSRQSRLHDHGVPVQVSVTGCVALASGTGITEAGFRCRGSFTLNGHAYTAVVSETNSLYPTGQTLAGIVDPDNPSNLTTQTAAAKSHQTWTAFVPASITALMLVLFIIVICWWRLRTRQLPT